MAVYGFNFCKVKDGNTNQCGLKDHDLSLLSLSTVDVPRMGSGAVIHVFILLLYKLFVCVFI